MQSRNDYVYYLNVYDYVYYLNNSICNLNNKIVLSSCF